jgi:hypothetical protein
MEGDDRFVNVNSSVDAGDERITELRGQQKRFFMQIQLTIFFF